MPAVSVDRVAQIRRSAVDARSSLAAPAAARRRPTRRDLLLGTAAATFGAVGGAVVYSTLDDTQPVAGPPTEALRWKVGEVPEAGLAVAGRTINHSWGVELLLDATGFPVGSSYRVVYLATSGDEVDAGGFIGSAVPIQCRCNGALLHDAAEAIEIRDAACRSRLPRPLLA